MNEVASRRRHPRHPCTGSAAIFHEGARCGWGTVTEIARGGCYIETNNTLSPGTCVNLRLTIAGLVFETGAAVAWSTPQVGMGVRFETDSAEFALKAAQFVQRVTGEITPANVSSSVPITARADQPVQPRSSSTISPEAAIRILNRIVQRARQSGSLSAQEIMEIVNANR